jgi:putative DNA primase/helicase
LSLILKDFNANENPENDHVYTVLKNSETIGERLVLLSHDKIKELAASEPELEIGWALPKNYTCITTTNKEIVKVIKNFNEACMIIEDANKNVFYIITEFEFKKTENNLLACGIACNTDTSNTKKTYVVPLPFKHPANKSKVLEKIKTVHYNRISIPPLWMRPIFKATRKTDNAKLDFPILDARTELKKMLLILKHTDMRTKEKEEMIKFINANLTISKLDEVELQETLEAGHLKAEEFFDPISGKFYHDYMGEYLIKEYHIKYDKVTNSLYFWDDKESIYRSDDNYLLHIITKTVPNLKSSQRQEVIDYMKLITYASAVKFNSDPMVIVFNNGIYNLRDKSFKEMTPDRYETIKIPANFDKRAKSSVADQFFKNITTGNKEIEQLLYEMIGYSMLKTNGLQKAFILLGGGRNGKSTLLILMRRLLGEDNVTSLSFKDLTNNFRASSLTNKLASLAGDISNQPIQDSDMVKAMIGGDLVKVEKKFKDSYDIEMFATMVFSANKLPRTPDTSDGFYRRFAIIPLKANLSKISKVQGQMFVEKLTQQQAIDYIATKATEYIYNVFHNTEDFISPKEVEALLETYKVENSSLLSWLRNKYHNDLNKLYGRHIHGVYIDYKDWCGDNHFSPVRSTRFRNELEELFEIEVSLDGFVEESDDEITFVTNEYEEEIDKRDSRVV